MLETVLRIQLWNMSTFEISFLNNHGTQDFREGEGHMYALKPQMFPSFILIFMGFIDCVTTAIGVQYFGAAELNPFLAGIVSTNIVAFLALKVSATFFIGFTFIMAKRTLNQAVDKSSRSFKISHSLIKIAYAGLVAFLVMVVINNLVVLLT